MNYFFIAIISIAAIAVQHTNCITLSTSPGTITSPNYPNSYNNNQFVIWNIDVDTEEQQIIELIVEDFITEPIFDVLNIYDGSSNNSILIASLSGIVLNLSPIYSSGTHLYLQFRTDASVVSTGFEISYRFTKSCICQLQEGALCGSRASATSEYLRGICLPKALYDCPVSGAAATLTAKCSQLLGCNEVSPGVDSCHVS